MNFAILLSPQDIFFLAININIFQTVTPATDCTHLQFQLFHSRLVCCSWYET